MTKEARYAHLYSALSSSAGHLFMSQIVANCSSGFSAREDTSKKKKNNQYCLFTQPAPSFDFFTSIHISQRVCCSATICMCLSQTSIISVFGSTRSGRALYLKFLFKSFLNVNYFFNFFTSYIIFNTYLSDC